MTIKAIPLKIAKSAANFRPWNVQSWPPLTVLYSISLLLFLFGKISEKPEFSRFCIKLLTGVLSIIVVKSIILLYLRYERLKIFDRCNIKSVGNKNVLSGNIFEVIIPDDNIHILKKYHKKLGKIFGIFYGPEPWVFTTDLELLHKIFVAEGHRYVDITQLRMPFITEMNNSLSQVQGEQWRWVRKILNPSFALKQMKSDNVYETIDECCDKVMQCIANHPLSKPEQSISTESRVVDMLYNMKKFSVEVIFQVAYGRNNGVNMKAGEKDILLEALHQGAKDIRGPVVWASIMFDGLDRALGLLSNFTAISKCIKLIHAELNLSLEERRRIGRQISLQERKMIDTIVEQVARNRMNDEMLKANLFFIFIAGFETSANTLAILFWLLARHPEMQEKLRSSIVSEGLEKSKYLEWCIAETLRLYPAVPTSVGRVLHEDFIYKQYTFKKGMTVNANIYSIHHEAEYWGQDVEDFRPERFGEPMVHALQYFAFGYGPRMCIGMNLAMAEMRAIIARVLLKYRIETCPSTPLEIEYITPNMIHMIIEGSIDLRLIELSSI